jgi:hypothetical protein
MSCDESLNKVLVLQMSSASSCMNVESKITCSSNVLTYDVYVFMYLLMFVKNTSVNECVCSKFS